VSRASSIAAFVVVAIAAIAISFFLDPGQFGLTPVQPVAPTTTASQNGEQSAALSVPDGAKKATIEYVHDGDTLFLTDGRKVRLLAIDTPEVGDNAECFGDEATARLRQLAPQGSTVYTFSDTDKKDQYGRSLLLLWTTDGDFINYDLVADGYAEAVFIGKNHLYEKEFEAAEDAAQSSGAGMWGSC
jgi:micrococcal nuclease